MASEHETADDYFSALYGFDDRDTDNIPDEEDEETVDDDDDDEDDDDEEIDEYWEDDHEDE